MNPNDSTEKEFLLHTRLTAEAEAERPEFSEPLHERIMRSVREAPRPASRRAVRRRAAFRLWAAGSAAAVAVTLAVWVYSNADRNAAVERPSPPRPGPVSPAPEVPPTPDTTSEEEASLAVVATPRADQLTALVDDTFAGSQWAYLDHDARLAAGMVLDHIPFGLSSSEEP